MRWKAQFVLGLFGVLSLAAYAAADYGSVLGSPPPFEKAGARGGEYKKVVRVVDGDTIVVSPHEKVRLIGVDTPETVHPKKAVECFGKDAKEFTRNAVEGKTVHLVFDQGNALRHHRDKYGRILAYVYLEDGAMLNRELIRQGFAHAYTRFPFRHLVEFRELERTARTQAIGLWARCRPN